MVDGQASLRHQFLKVSQAQAESAVPPDAGHDDVRLELSLPEQRWTAGLHGLNLSISQLQHFHSNGRPATKRRVYAINSSKPAGNGASIRPTSPGLHLAHSSTKIRGLRPCSKDSAEPPYTVLA